MPASVFKKRESRSFLLYKQIQKNDKTGLAIGFPIQGDSADG